MVIGWLPNLHAALVHFPIGLLFAAVAVDVAALVAPHRRTVRPVSTILYIAGTCALIGTYLAGRSAAATVHTPGMAHAVVSEHWQWAFGVTLYFALFTLGRLGAALLGLAGRVGWSVLVVTGAFGLILLAETADRGAQLVYRHGVGVIGGDADD